MRTTRARLSIMQTIAIVVVALLGTAFSLVNLWSGGVGIGSEPSGGSPSVSSPRQYEIDATLDPLARTVRGQSTLSLTNDKSASFTSLFFHLYPNAFAQVETTPAPVSAYDRGFQPGGIAVFQVTVDGQLTPSEIKGTQLRVDLPAPIKPGQTVRLQMRWTLTVPPAAYRFGSKDGTFMLGNWYPVLAVWDDQGWHLDEYAKIGDPFFSEVADYRVRLCVPTYEVVAATGVLEQEEILNSQTKRLTFKAERVRDFALVVSPDLQVATVLVGQTTVRSYFYPAHRAAGLAALTTAAQALDYYSQRFGEYPYQQFSLVEVPMEGFAGMEYPQLTMLSHRQYPGAGTVGDWAALIAHEVAHQWWYGLVGNDQFAEPWLDEALAVYSAQGFMRDVLSWPVSGGTTVTGKAKYNSDRQRVGQPLSAFRNQRDYFTYIYNQGAQVWAELERGVGRELTDQILRQYWYQYRYRNATTRNLLEVANSVAGRDLTDFFPLVSPAPVSQVNEVVPQVVPESVAVQPASNSQTQETKPAGPDLVIKNLTLLNYRERSRLVIQVANLGNEPAGEFKIIAEESTNGRRWKKLVRGLAPGKTYTYSLDGPFSLGRIMVDAEDQVKEADENNNVREYQSIDYP